MKIRGVMARKGDTPEYARRMQQELFDVLAKARSKDEFRMIEPMAKGVREKYMQELEDADVRELAFHRRVSRINYSRRCAEASAVRAYQKRGLSLATGMEIGYVVTNAAKWEFDAGYYRKLLEKAWKEVAFVLAKHD
jgi:DNA polymerase, archaea type